MSGIETLKDVLRGYDIAEKHVSGVVEQMQTFSAIFGLNAIAEECISNIAFVQGSVKYELVEPLEEVIDALRAFIESEDGYTCFDETELVEYLDILNKARIDPELRPEEADLMVGVMCLVASSLCVLREEMELEA